MVRATITQTRGYETQKSTENQSFRGLDLKIKRGQDEFQLVRRWFAEENDSVSGSPI